MNIGLLYWECGLVELKIFGRVVVIHIALVTIKIINKHILIQIKLVIRVD